MQTKDTERNRITEKPTMDKWFTDTETVAHAGDSTNVATKTITDVNKIRFEDTKTAGTAKITNATARNSTDMNLIRFKDTNMTAVATKATNATAEIKAVANVTEVTDTAARGSTNVIRFEDIETTADITKAMNTTTNKTTASAAEATNATAKSSTNMNVIRFEDTKTGAAGAVEVTNTTAEAKAVGNAIKETNAAIRNFVGDISKDYIGTFQFGKAKTIASAAEMTNATRNFTDVNRFEETKMAAGVTEVIDPTKYFDVHMIWREIELYRREKELAERELMLARKEIEMLRQALIDAANPQKICCCFERKSLQDEDCESVSVSRQDRRSCKQQRLEHEDQRH